MRSLFLQVICVLRDHNPYKICAWHVGESNLWRCLRCRAEAVLDVGRESYQSFRERATMNPHEWMDAAQAGGSNA